MTSALGERVLSDSFTFKLLEDSSLGQTYCILCMVVLLCWVLPMGSRRRHPAPQRQDSAIVAHDSNLPNWHIRRHELPTRISPSDMNCPYISHSPNGALLHHQLVTQKARKVFMSGLFDNNVHHFWLWLSGCHMHCVVHIPGNCFSSWVRHWSLRKPPLVKPPSHGS